MTFNDKKLLVDWIQELEAHVQHLEARICQLEQEHHTYSPHNPKAQMGALTYHGPDTVSHFDMFSVIASLPSSGSTVLISSHSLNAWAILQ